MAEQMYTRRVLKSFEDKENKGDIYIKGDKFTGDQERINELVKKKIVSGEKIVTMKDKQKPVKKKQVETADKKVEAETENIEHVGGGYYELPNGEKVQGKENALKALQNGGE